MPSMTRNIPPESELAKKILKECSVRVQASERELSEKYTKWAEAEDTTLAYVPTREIDRKKKVERSNGLPQYTTIQIPYTYAVMMAAHTYLTSVFMGRNPVLQFSGRHGESEMSVQALEALIDYQMLVGNCLVPIWMWLLDSVKYGIGVGEIYWENRVESFTNISEQANVDPILGIELSPPKKVQTTVQRRTYSGNRFRNVQPQDFLWDTRFPAWNFQAGEYCAKRFYATWNDIVRRKKQGFYIETAIDKIKAKSTGQNAVGSSESSMQRPEATDAKYTTWDITELATKHPSGVKGYEVHIDIIPSEWKLGGSDYPEKWVFTCTGDFSVLMGAQPLGALHCKFPFSVLCLEPEAYGLTVRGFPEILEPVQQTVDWLINSHFYNVRAALNNQMVVDPSRVVMKDVLDPLPGGIIRLKPAAYGQDPKLSINQLQVTDVTQNHLRDLQMMLGIGERTVGINDQIMGMMGGSGRKTATEVRTSTSFGVNRLKSISEFYGASGFDPMSQIMVANSQQYLDMDMKFKIAGDLMQNAGKLIQVNEDAIAGAYDFVAIDGTLPIDRYAQSNLWLNMFQQIQRMPQIMAQYDLGRIFEFVAQLAGLKNIGQFKVQVGSPEQLAQQAAAGNVIPMPGKGGGSPPAATSPEPGQMAGMGATG